MKKKALSVILSLLLVAGISLPCYAANDELETIVMDSESEIVMTVPVEEILEVQNNSQSDTDPHSEQLARKISQLLNIDENIDVSAVSFHGEADVESLTAGERALSRNSSAMISRAVPVSVSTESQLIAALADSSKDTIRIAQNITLTEPLVIERSVSIIATSSKSIIAPVGKRHITISNQLDNVEIVFSNVILDGNNLGGGIEITASNVYIFGAVIRNCCDNEDFDGGAIYATNVIFSVEDGVATGTLVGSLTLEACEFDGNDAEGASVVSLGQFNATEVSVLNNSEGSGIAVMNLTDTPMTTTLTDVIVQGNTSDSFGGGIYLAGVTATITGTMTTDETTGETTSTSVISGNTSNYGGGGIYSYLSATSVTGTIINNNTCNYDGDYGNYEGIELGGAGIMSVGALSLTDSHIVGNHANCVDASGAGVYVASTKAYRSNLDIADDLIFISDFTVTNCKINDNEGHYIVNGENQEYCLYGGGMFLYGVYVDITNTEIEGNSASIGGGMYVLYEFGLDTPAVNWNNPDVKLSGVSIQDNSATMMGGGINVMGGYDINRNDNVIDGMNSLFITDESVINGNSSSYGGGISTIGFSTIIEDGSEVAENTVAGDLSLYDEEVGLIPNWSGAGAGILLYESNLELKDAAISENTATPEESQTAVYSAGGGIYAKDICNISVTNSASLISFNESSLGGGIYTEYGSTLAVSKGTITRNSATHGAGVYGAGAVNMLSGTISNNTAAESGGGIYINASGAITLSNGSISGNNAQNGGGIYSVAPMIINGGGISSNTASQNGGGIFATKNVVMNVNSNGSAVYIFSNTADGCGGGVYYQAANATWTMHGGTITQNYAGDGGGVYCFGPRMNWIMNNGEISLNMAFKPSGISKGGGVYCSGSLASFTMNGGIIKENFATYGGGIYFGCNGFLNDGEIWCNFSMRTEDEPPLHDHGAGIYIEANKTVVCRKCLIHENFSDYELDPDPNIYLEPGASYITYE